MFYRIDYIVYGCICKIARKKSNFILGQQFITSSIQNIVTQLNKVNSIKVITK
jgi:hypothetical protein